MRDASCPKRRAEQGSALADLSLAFGEFAENMLDRRRHQRNKLRFPQPA
jgi:hypothetical protein